MQREIEFRVWDKIANEMLDLSSKPTGKNYRFYQYYYDLRLIGIDLIDELSTDKNFGLMQFTGLLDKNGKKIFEGDLLKAKSLVVEVFYDKGAFYFCRDLPILLNAMNQELRIVGNIFENPELLEG
jgi:uncharacterized phage protein (TIGR01671 family)